MRLTAARAVRHGRRVSCAWEVTAPDDMERSTTSCPCTADMPGAGNMPAAFHADRRWGFSSERLGISFHGNTLIHVDSPCHLFWDGTMDNGRSHSLVDAATGSAWAAVTAAANEIVTRGVLLDVARILDVPWLEAGQGVFPDDLEEAERRQGVRVRPGDAVLLRTGYGRARHESGAATGFTRAGWHASCLPWLHERQVALIGADTPQDVQPSGYGDVLMPVHAVSLVAMGLWLLDNCDLEACVAGPAFTVRCAPGDNLMLHAAIYRAEPGSVVVVESGDLDYALAGGNVCAVAQRRGIAAFVLDGLIRDLTEVRAAGFPVFARGVIPIPGTKKILGDHGTTVRCGGIDVDPGDIVVADEDGIVVVPHARQAEVLAAARGKLAKKDGESLDDWEAAHRARIEKALRGRT